MYNSFTWTENSMFLTLKQAHNINTQLSFDELLQADTPLITNQITENKTFITNIPKQTPNHILRCKQILKIIANSYSLKSMTKDAIAKEYTTHKIKKKTGGFRTIHAPSDMLKNTQRNILYYLQQINTLPHEAAYAYIKGRSIYNAVAKHQQNNSKWFLKIDLKNFFESCTETFIYQQLKKIYPFKLLTLDQEYDTIIKQIITIACLNNKLPQGNPLAPYLTNLIMVPIDYRLDKLLPVYTRYSDDMLFSARTQIDMDMTIKNIENILIDTPLKINYKKTRLGSINGNNWNLGLMLNKDNNITVGHEKKRRFKAAIDQFLRNPEAYTLNQIQKLSGLTAYFLFIEPEYFTHIIKKYNSKHNKDLLYLLHQ